MVSSLDDDMEPLFDNDWLHEHNLDVLFDLFEEEIEGGKGLVEAASSGSSTIFGTSPVTSYLFGTSPSLASALDLYDLLYFDNQQQQQQQPSSSSQQQQQQHQQTTASAATTSVNVTSNSTYNIDGTPASRVNPTQQQQHHATSQNVSTNQITDSILNAMRIKRKMRKGQSEGVSLLARPRAGNSANNSSNSGSSSCNNNTSSMISNNINGDKTSTKITNLKTKPNSNISYSKAIDINHSKQSHINNNINHYRYRARCAIIQEHAYAVRGH